MSVLLICLGYVAFVAVVLLFMYGAQKVTGGCEGGDSKWWEPSRDPYAADSG